VDFRSSTAGITAQALFGLPTGVVAWALVGVAVSLMFFAYHLVDAFNRINQVEFARTDRRWRFFSAIGWLMLVVLVQCVTFGLFAGRGLGVIAGASEHWGVWILIGQGFVAFPVIWLELIFTRNWEAVGFTRAYEENCNRLFPERMQEYYSDHGFSTGSARHGKDKPANLFVRFGGFLGTWIWIYVWTPLRLFHLRQDWKFRRFDQGVYRRIQAVQDLLVFLTVVMFLYCLLTSAVSALAQYAHFAVPWWFPPAGILVWTVGLLWLMAVVIAVVALLTLPVPEQGDSVVFWLLFFWGLTVALDIIGLGERGFFGWVLKWLGGVTVVTLTVMMAVLIVRLAREIQGVERAVAEFLRHRMSNLLLPARTGIRLALQELEIAGTGEAAVIAPEARGMLVRQLRAGMTGLKSTSGLVDRGDRLWDRAEAETWVKLRELLDGLRIRCPVDQSVTLHIEDQLPDVRVLAPKRRLEDALANLVVNAVQAIAGEGTGGTVRIRVGSSSVEGFEIELSVSNTGLGIPEPVRGRVFELGFTTKSPGMGIGLAQVKTLMQDLGGDVRLAPEADGEFQTVFQLLFPTFRFQYADLVQGDTQ